MTINSIPNAAHPIAGGNRVDPTWYKWLRELDREARDTGADLSAEIQAIARKLGSPDGTIDGIPESSQSLTALPPLAISGNQITLSTLTADTAGELFGISRDAYGRISALRPVVAGAGITIDGTTDPDEIAIVNSGLVNPMTTAGDLIRGGVAGAPERLAIGTDTQVLTVVSGVPAWAAAPGGLSNPMTTAEDLIKGGASGVPARLAVGSNGQVLTVTAGAVGWATPSGLTNPMTTAGDIITGGASGVPQRLAVGSAGQVLKVVSGAPAWAAESGGVSRPLALYMPTPNSGTITTIGTSAPTIVGSAIARAPASTNQSTARPRIGYQTLAPSTTNTVGVRFTQNAQWRATGFFHSAAWMVSQGGTVSTHRAFSGLRNSTVAPTDVNPSTLTLIAGFGYDSGDANVQFMHNDGSGTATKVSTGIAKPTANDSAAFFYTLSADPGGNIAYSITEVISGTTFSGTATTDLPATTDALYTYTYASVGGTSSAIGIDHYEMTWRFGSP